MGQAVKSIAQSKVWRRRLVLCHSIMQLKESPVIIGWAFLYPIGLFTQLEIFKILTMRFLLICITISLPSLVLGQFEVNTNGLADNDNLELTTFAENLNFPVAVVPLPWIKAI